MRSRRGDEMWPGPPWGSRRGLAVFGPFFLAFVQVLGTQGASRGQPDATALDALAGALLIAGPLALLLVQRHPVTTLAVVAGVTWVYLLRGYPYGPGFTSLAVAVVVTIATRSRVLGWAALAATALLGLVVAATDGGLPLAAVFGALAWVLVVGVIGELARTRRARLAEVIRTRREMVRRQAGEERLQIARELHDVVAHHMSLINVQAGVALHLTDRDPAPAQVVTALSTIKDASKEALTELRSLIGVLRADGESAPLLPVTRLASLPDLVARTAQAGVTLRTSVTGDVATLPAAVDLAAYRIIQEAITNVVRHSGASNATVAVDVTDDRVDVVVQDDGRGLTAAAADSNGSGVRGMQERAQALGGSVRVTTAATGGVRVHALLPRDGRP